MENKSVNKFDKALKITGLVLIILEGVLSALLIVMLINFNVLPLKFLIAIIAALVLIFAGLFFLRFARKSRDNANGDQSIDPRQLDVKDITLDGDYSNIKEKHRTPQRVRRIVSGAISLIMCFVLAVGSFYVYRTEGVIDSVTGEGKSIRTYYVSVGHDDPAEDMPAAADYLFGTISKLETAQFSEAISLINNAAGKTVETKDYDSVNDLLDALYSGEIKGIIYESSLRGMFNDILDQYNETIETKDGSTAIAERDFAKDFKTIYTQKIVVQESETDNTVETTTAETTTAETTSKTSGDIQPFIVLLSGNDEYDEVSVTGRSDVNMLAVVDYENHQLMFVSIPRDYYVYFPGVSGDSRDKLTHAGNYGMEVLCDSINEAFDINIDYYVRVNFTSVINIIDAVNGIEVENPDEFSITGYDFEYTFEPGTLWLDGYWSLIYMRERKSLEDGDLGRGRHQQIILKAMVNRLVSAQSIVNYNSLMDAVETCAITNMPEDMIKQIIRDQLDSGSEWTIFNIQALGEEVYQPSFAMDGEVVSVVMPYKESVEYVTSCINRVLSGEIITDITEGAPDEDSMTYITDLIDCD